MLSDVNYMLAPSVQVDARTMSKRESVKNACQLRLVLEAFSVDLP